MVNAAHASAPKAIEQADIAVRAAERVLHAARTGVRSKVASAGLDDAQHSAHGLAWLATYVEALRQLRGWGQRLSDSGRLGEMEELLLIGGTGEYAAQIAGG